MIGSIYVFPYCVHPSVMNFDPTIFVDVLVEFDLDSLFKLCVNTPVRISFYTLNVFPAGVTAGFFGMFGNENVIVWAKQISLLCFFISFF